MHFVAKKQNFESRDYSVLLNYDKKYVKNIARMPDGDYFIEYDLGHSAERLKFPFVPSNMNIVLRIGSGGDVKGEAYMCFDELSDEMEKILCPDEDGVITMYIEFFHDEQKSILADIIAYHCEII